MSSITSAANAGWVDYYPQIQDDLDAFHQRVREMRSAGRLSAQVLKRIQKFFRIKGIYHSNAIEGNSLTLGETRLVVEEGMTISGKTLRDQSEAKNLSEAIDFMERLVTERERPITLAELRQIHYLILKDIDDAGAGQYRQTRVRISGSHYEPPAPERLNEQMGDLGMWLSWAMTTGVERYRPIVIAAAAHAWLAQVHPFVDGNGRTCRLLMNLVMMRQSYPICIINREDRLRYYDALEQSQAGDLTPLIQLIYENTLDSLEEWEKAAAEQRQEDDWLDSITSRFAQPARAKAQNEYELWANAMDLLRTYVKQTADAWNERQLAGARVNVRDFGMLSFEQYLALREGERTKRTWFFRMDFHSGVLSARYLFFFGYAARQIRQRAPVTLMIAKETDPMSGFYERLDNFPQTANIPKIYQIGFDMRAEQYVAWTAQGEREGRAETLIRSFLEDVVKYDFQ